MTIEKHDPMTPEVEQEVRNLLSKINDYSIERVKLKQDYLDKLNNVNAKEREVRGRLNALAQEGNWEGEFMQVKPDEALRSRIRTSA